MEKNWIILIVAIVLIIVIIGGYYFLNLNKCNVLDSSKCDRSCNIDSDCKTGSCSCINKNEIMTNPNHAMVDCIEFGCKCINNKCGESVKNNLDTNCSKAGENVYMNNKWKCCTGLVAIPKSCYENESSRVPSAIAQICSDCGNGICETWESSCNCPKDCI
ncbi:Uncharacterised protein [uncultured archaeon]|nr:Uncharacterised protein [uncultured archaeon]